MKEPTGSAGTAERLYRDCVQLVFKHRLRSLLSVFAASFLPLVMGWRADTRAVTIIFVIALWLYTFVNLYISRRVNSSVIRVESAATWGWFFQVQLMIVGLLFDGVFLYLATHGVPGSLILLVFVSTGLSAGAAAAYHHLKWAVSLFLASAFLPQIAYSLIRPTGHSALLAVAMVVFFIFMTLVSLELHENTTHSLLIGYELETAKDAAEHRASTDTLTGLQNRRAFFETAPHLLANAKRHSRSISLIMLDVDHFKSINDKFGHATGDKALASVAQTLETVIRESDFVARLGGEEFAILLPDTNVAGAREIAERLRAEIQRIDLSRAGIKTPITGSFGIASYDGDCGSIAGLLEHADKALYLAKREGRNRSKIFDPSIT